MIIPKNSGWATEIKAGDSIRIEGETTVDFVAFNVHDLNEKFDQARTKVVNAKIFLSTGDKLLSNYSNWMFEIVEDTYTKGTHDLQKGMCSRQLWDKWADELFQRYSTWEKLGRKLEDLPDHGCWESLSGALKTWGIQPYQIPSPFNIFQTMRINEETGKMEYATIKPDPGTYVILEAEMDCVVGVSACPEGGRGKPIKIQIQEKGNDRRHPRRSQTSLGQLRDLERGSK
ncbi:MAG: DUF1989 domain-containing protein [Dehalococcoidia bacterium]